MSKWRWPIRAAVALIGIEAAVGAAPTAPSSPPPASATRQAHVALGFDPLKRCPDLRPAAAEDQGVAVVVFRVGPTGVPSRPSIASSSQSEGLDAAAMSCVLRLRFQAATSAGDGNPVESWQQMAWKWARAAQHQAGASATTTAVPAAADGAHAVAIAATQANDAGQRRASISTSEGRAEVKVCVDEAGRLTQEPALVRSSGDPQFDAAAVRVARAASGQYWPPTTEAKPVAGCLQLAIKGGQ
jgi:TonB family protein